MGTGARGSRHRPTRWFDRAVVVAGGGHGGRRNSELLNAKRPFANLPAQGLNACKQSLTLILPHYPHHGRGHAISEDSIALDAANQDRQGITIGALRSTLFLQGGQSASWKDLKVGAQIDVDAITDSNELYAINVAFEKPPAHGHSESSPLRWPKAYDADWQFGNRCWSGDNLLAGKARPFESSSFGLLDSCS